MASCLKPVMVNQLVSPSIHLFCSRSNRRCDDARRNEVIGRPSCVIRCLGVVATRPEMVTSSVTTYLSLASAQLLVTKIVRFETSARLNTAKVFINFESRKRPQKITSSKRLRQNGLCPFLGPPTPLKSPGLGFFRRSPGGTPPPSQRFRQARF